MPSDSSASISPSARAVPNSTALEVPERASTRMAVSSGPSSRTTTVTMTGPMYSCAPKRVSCSTVCPMITKPSMTPMRLTIGSSRTPALQMWSIISGWTTRLERPNFVNVTPSVIIANATNSCSTPQKRRIHSPAAPMHLCHQAAARVTVASIAIPSPHSGLVKPGKQASNERRAVAKIADADGQLLCAQRLHGEQEHRAAGHYNVGALGRQTRHALSFVKRHGVQRGHKRPQVAHGKRRMIYLTVLDPCESRDRPARADHAPSAGMIIPERLVQRLAEKRRQFTEAGVGKAFGQSHRAQRQTLLPVDHTGLAEDEFGAAATDIHHQNSLFRPCRVT